jgi:hypothetical protein
VMQNDNLDRFDRIDRADLCRLADDGCPHADTRAYDLTELWSGLGKDDQASG